MDGVPAKYLNRSAAFCLENLNFWRKIVAVLIITHSNWLDSKGNVITPLNG